MHTDGDITLLLAASLLEISSETGRPSSRSCVWLLRSLFGSKVGVKTFQEGAISKYMDVFSATSSNDQGLATSVLRFKLLAESHPGLTENASCY